MAKITEVDDGRDGDATLGKARTRHEEMKELQALADEITEDARDGSGTTRTRTTTARARARRKS